MSWFELADVPWANFKPHVSTVSTPVRYTPPRPLNSREIIFRAADELGLPQPWEGATIPDGPINTPADLVRYLDFAEDQGRMWAAMSVNERDPRGWMEQKYRPVLRNAFRCLRRVEIIGLPEFDPSDERPAEELMRRLRAWLLHLPSRESAGETADALAATTIGELATQRSAFARDHLWLKWKEENRLGPAMIRSKWNSLTDSQREEICPAWPAKIGEGDKGRETVKKAIQTAKSERNSQQN